MTGREAEEKFDACPVSLMPCCSSQGLDALSFCSAHLLLQMGNISLQGHAGKGWQVLPASFVSQQGLCCTESLCSLTGIGERQPLFSKRGMKSCCVSLAVFSSQEIIQNTFHNPFMFWNFRINGSVAISKTDWTRADSRIVHEIKIDVNDCYLEKSVGIQRGAGNVNTQAEEEKTLLVLL